MLTFIYNKAMSEMIDVLDFMGNSTGRVLPKDEVHKFGFWHAGAHLWITDGNGNVMQQYRDPSKKILPGVWDIAVAGHVSAGETPEQTVIKEAEEEIGLRLHPGDFNHIGVTVTDMLVRITGEKHRVHDHNFVMRRAIDLSSLTLQEGETADVRWYPIDQLETDLYDPAHSAEHAHRPPEDRKLYMLAIGAMRRLTKHG